MTPAARAMIAPKKIIENRNKVETRSGGRLKPPLPLPLPEPEPLPPQLDVQPPLPVLTVNVLDAEAL